MVVKKTWNELLQENNGLTTNLITQKLSELATALDSAFNTKYGESNTLSKIANLLAGIQSDYFVVMPSESGNGLWEDLPIYLSSYKLKDRRCANYFYDKLMKYITFLTKMITDEGLQRKMVVSRNFSNRNTSHNTDKNVYSETPQLELQSFEEAINYASNVSRNDNDGGSTQAGTSGETATNVNWEEALKNLQFAFYNELVDYICSIPNEVYRYYSLDSYPCTELLKYSYETLRNLYHL